MVELRKQEKEEKALRREQVSKLFHLNNCKQKSSTIKICQYKNYFMYFLSK